MGPGSAVAIASYYLSVKGNQPSERLCADSAHRARLIAEGLALSAPLPAMDVDGRAEQGSRLQRITPGVGRGVVVAANRWVSCGVPEHIAF